MRKKQIINKEKKKSFNRNLRSEQRSDISLRSTS